MEEEEEVIVDADGGSDEGPGREYDIYIKNEEMVDKLKLLNYEDGFLKMGGAYKSIQRHYFVRSTNVGEQFFLFTSLAAWLIRKCGNEDFPMPQEFDDPNSTISEIVAELRNKGAIVEFAANKLKSGAGESVIFVLDALADLALIHVGFKWEKMIPPPDEDDDVHVDEEENDDEGGQVEEEMIDVVDDDDDAVMVDLTAPTMLNNEETPIQGILQSTTNAISWKQEVDRVAPLLKISVRQDAKDWRMHLEQMHTMQKHVSDQIGVIEPQLGQMATELSKTLERIESREKTMNQQMATLLSKFRQSQDRRAELREKYKSASVGVSSRTEALQRISDDIEQLKQQIEEQGAKSSDGAPLLKIKQAVTKMEEEIQRMNVQIGTLEQSILTSYLRDRFSYNADLYNIY